MVLILPIHEHGVSYNFLSTDLLHPWLDLFLDISFFLKQS